MQKYAWNVWFGFVRCIWCTCQSCLRSRSVSSPHHSRQVFWAVMGWKEKGDTLYTTFRQAVTCALCKHEGSMSRELGFTTQKLRSVEACVCWYLRPFTFHLCPICLSHPLPSTSLCLLPDSQVCKELSLPSCPPLAAGMHVYPPPPPLPFFNATNPALLFFN